MANLSYLLDKNDLKRSTNSNFDYILQLQLAQMGQEMSRDDMHGLSVSGTISGGDSSSGGGASPLTARSIRLERFAQALANSQEELRR